MDWKEKFHSQYMSMVPLRDFLWMEHRWKEDPSWQKTILDSTLNHPLAKTYPVLKGYSLNFLKILISKIEELSCEVDEEIYQLYLKILNRKDTPETFFITYIMNPSIPRITVEENTNKLSGGTTGLRTWEAAYFLAEWIYHNKNLFSNKNILELGCGIGFTGIFVNFTCSPRRYVFTDGHHLVLQQVKKNIALNCKEFHLTHCKRSQAELEVNSYNINDPSEENTDENWSPDYVCDECEKDLPKMQVSRLDWEEDNLCNDTLQDFDIILASDVVYFPTLIPSLVKILQWFLFNSSRSSVAYIACTIRNPETIETFLNRLARKNILYELMDGNFPHLFSCNRSSIKLWKLTPQRFDECC